MFFKVLSIQPLGTPHCLCNKIRTPFCGLQGPTPNGLVFLLPVTHASHQPGTFWPQIFTSGHPLAGDQHFTAPSPVRVPWSTPLASPHTSRHSPHHPGSLSLYAQSTEIICFLAHCPLRPTREDVPEAQTSTVIPTTSLVPDTRSLHKYWLEGFESSGGRGARVERQKVEGLHGWVLRPCPPGTFAFLGLGLWLTDSTI